MSKEENSATGSLVPIESEVDFPDWSKEKEGEAEDLINLLKDYYSSYSLPRGLNIREAEESLYHNRENKLTKPGKPLIDISEGREIEALAHEMAHDVLSVYLDSLHESTLVSSTFKELFADLNQLYFTEAEPEDRKFERKMQKEPAVFEGVEIP